MNSRRGEKLGWTLGWCGGFVWVVILAIVAWVQGKTLHAAAGLAIVIALFRLRETTDVDEISLLRW